jgi:photosystem II stability/assembly factor-like uncharacterized protein
LLRLSDFILHLCSIKVKIELYLEATKFGDFFCYIFLIYIYISKGMSIYNTSLTFTDIENTQITLKYTLTGSGTVYLYQFAGSTAPTTNPTVGGTLVATVTSPATNSTRVITGLTSNNQYTFAFYTANGPTGTQLTSSGGTTYKSATTTTSNVLVNYNPTPSNLIGSFMFNSCAISGTNAIAVGYNNSNGVIYYSTNSGQTWTPTTSNLRGSYYLNSCAISGITAIVVGQNSTNGVIYYSTDSGSGFTTWTAVTTSNLRGSFNFNSCAFSGTNAIAIGVGVSGAIYYSTNSGQTWNPTTSDLRNSSEFYSCAFSGTNAITVGYLGSTRGAIYYSTNSGQTWTATTSSLTNSTRFNSCALSGTNAIAVGYFGTRSAIYYSTDSGATWTATASSLTGSQEFTSCAFSGINAIAVGYFTTRGAIYYSTDSGATWTATASSLTGSLRFDSCALSGTNAIAVGQNNTNTNGSIYYSAPPLNPTLTLKNITSTSMEINYTLENTGNTYLTRFTGSSLLTADPTTGTYITTVTSPATDSYNDTGLSLNTQYTYAFYNQISTNASQLTSNGTTAQSATNTTSCYIKGTKLLCLVKGEEIYVPIEDLRKGTLVKTYKHGYKPIELIGKSTAINYSDDPFKTIYKLKSCETTIVTGGHYILVDELPEKITPHGFYKHNYTIDDKKIILPCDSKLFEAINDNNIYETYHLVLESENNEKGYGIYAENDLLTESTSKKHFLHANFKLI